MKHILLILTASCLLLPSCLTKSQPQVDRFDPQKIAALGNIALTVANKRGVVSDKDAAMARAAGVLILEAEASETPLAAISEAAVAIAVREGSLTPEEAGLLREVGTVLLKPEPGPVNPLLPPVE